MDTKLKGFAENIILVLSVVLVRSDVMKLTEKEQLILESKLLNMISGNRGMIFLDNEYKFLLDLMQAFDEIRKQANSLTLNIQN